MNRVLIAGAQTGSGKTTISCALLAALKARGLHTAAFKCGPDYIDPMFHRKAIGVPSHNLDSYFCEKDALLGLLAGSGARDINIIEGVMGYYDGIGNSVSASTYEIARLTETPVVLVINARGMSNSACAVLKGFCDYQADSNIRGVIFNGLAPTLYDGVADIAENMGIRALGCFPYEKELAIESRHLGLVTADEIEGIHNRLTRLGELAEQYLDIDGLLCIAGQAPTLQVFRTRQQLHQADRLQRPAPRLHMADKAAHTLHPYGYRRVFRTRQRLHQVDRLRRTAPVLREIAKTARIAVSSDEAFCFLYTENIELLQRLGAEIVYFSPLNDAALPEGVNGLYICGGYPELHVERLSANKGMLSSIRAAIDGGMPTIAECGGFMYLHKTLGEYPMVGAIDAAAYETSRLQRFGYIELTANTDNLLCKAGESIRSHEFHYWDSDSCGDGFTVAKAGKDSSWQCIHATDTLYAGFPHLYLPSNAEFARNFIRKAAVFG